MIYFVNPTAHLNVGDIAIFYATLKFFNDNKLNYQIINSDNYKNFTITKNDTIAILGGGWIGIYECSITDFYFRVIKEHKDAKIVFLPSSFFPVTNSFKSICDINATIFARDPLSFENYKKWFKNAEVYECDDMVFYLDRIDSTEKYIKTDVGVFNRNDIESIKENNALLQKYVHNGNSETRILSNWIPFKDDLKFFEDFVYRFLFKMTKYKTIITDSLHMAIFSYLIKRRCYILDNKYHKVTNTWKKYNCDSIQVFNDKFDANFKTQFNNIKPSFSKILEIFKEDEKAA